MRITKVLLGLFIITFMPLFGQESLKVLKIEFSGNDSISDEALLNIMNTKKLTPIQRATFWIPNALYSPSTLNEDVARLKKYYQQNGFLDPIISTVSIPNKKKTKTKIIISVVQGKAIFNGALNYTSLKGGLPPKLKDPKDMQLPLKSGCRFRDDDVYSTQKELLDFYNNNGYPFSKVSKEITLNENTGLADINFNVSPHKKAYFGPVTLKGDSLIPQSYIFKHIGIKEGNEYSQQKLDKTQDQLFELGLFKYVTIRASLDSIDNPKIPVLIQLKEMPRWSVKNELGYGTEDRIRMAVNVTGLNFLGGGRTFILKALHSYYVPLSIDVRFIQPDVGVQNLDLILNPFLIREREDSYTVDRLGTSITLQKKISAKSLTYLSYNLGVDEIDFSDSYTSDSIDDVEEGRNLKSGLTFGFKKNSTDNALYPTKGLKYNLVTNYMGVGFDSNYHYFKVISEIDYFLPLPRKIVVAGKLKGGIMMPVQGDATTPIEDRFLMGGSLSLRGWGRNKVSPLNEDGDKIGGNSMLEASLELRFPIYGVVSGVAFVDVGNVWKDQWQFNLMDLNSNLGLGLRIKSPIGPIRFDVAAPVANDVSNTQFYITVGHAF